MFCFCNVELFVCYHLFCICACVKYLHVLYLILVHVQGQVRNHYLSGCPELLNGPAQFVKAIKTPDKHLTIVISRLFFSNTVKILKLFIIMVTILSWVHWLYSMKQRQWESSPQSVMVKHWITIVSFQKVIISLPQLDTKINLESWNTGKVMDLMLSFFYIYLALNMIMLVTDCLEFIAKFLFHVLFFQGQIKVFISKTSDHFKTFVWYGSLVSTCFQH